MEAGRMEDDQQFCLRWNNHQSTLVSVFDTLLEKGIHVDCTLAAEGQTLRAHKVVLSACSPYFESVLSQQYDKHPIIILKDVKYAELRAMMDYMYRGEVNISQEQLGALLKAAESLQIKGLSDNKPPRHSAHPPRPTTPQTQTRDSSTESREGSASPTRRRKKVRRNSTSPAPPTLPVAVPPAAPVPVPVPVAPLPPKEETCKEEAPGVEDLTLDEEADPTQTPHDAVRNFQWHMERSQDDLISPGDGRDTQDRRISPRSIVTRSKRITDSAASILTVLKNATPPLVKPPETPPAPILPTPLPPPQLTKTETAPTTPTETKVTKRRITSDKQYQCVNCGRRYNARRNLVRHMTLECGRDPRYKCPYCNYTKHRRNELKRHIEKKHPSVPPSASTPPRPLTVN